MAATRPPARPPAGRTDGPHCCTGRRLQLRATRLNSEGRYRAGLGRGELWEVGRGGEGRGGAGRVLTVGRKHRKRCNVSGWRQSRRSPLRHGPNNGSAVTSGTGHWPAAPLWRTSDLSPNGCMTVIRNSFDVPKCLFDSLAIYHATLKDQRL